MFSHLKLFEHLGELVLPQRKISHLRMAIYRITAAPADVVRQRGDAGILRHKPFQSVLRLRKMSLGHCYHLTESHLQRPMPDVLLYIAVQQCSEYGRQHQNHQPCDLGSGIQPAVEQIDDHDYRK